MDVVGHLSRVSAQTDTLIKRLDASESAVYNALANLEERELVCETEDGWELTGHGQLVADSIKQWQSIDQLVADDPEYWKTHQTDVLPAAFRQRLTELNEYEIVRGKVPEVDKHLRAFATRMQRVDNCRIISAVYVPGHDDIIPNSPETKILLTRGVIDTMLGQLKRGEREQLDPVPKAPVRLAPVGFGLNVASDHLCLSLPTHAGIHDTTATLVAETESAVQWGEELFASLWTDADPVEEYLQTCECYDMVCDES